MELFATCPKGMDDLLAAELQALGAEDPACRGTGVAFHGECSLAYRVCLWSRVAGRVLLPLARFPAADDQALYQAVSELPWEEHLAPEGSLAVDFSTSESGIRHSRYGAQRVKDAVVDRFRARCGRRPSVDLQRPDLRINVHLHRDQADLSLDLGGGSLHRRGYRRAGGAAPLKENLAAAILLRAGWPAIAAGGGSLVDPLCGSGTLSIEAALMAADIAPGLLRSHHGASGWLQHDPALWQALMQEAEDRRREGLERLPLIAGFDADPKAVAIARDNAGRAGLADRLRFECRSLEELAPPAGAVPGLVVANPPYGERLGDVHALAPLYETLGQRLKAHFPGWRAAVFTANPDLAACLGLRAHRRHSLYNGPLPCRLLHYSLTEKPPDPAPRERSSGAGMFANRLEKNLRSLGRWVRREGIDCYRLYDADMPEYALAVDCYRTVAGETWVHAQEYQAPASVAPADARRRLAEARAVLPQVLGIPPERVVLKLRRRQKGSDQYRRLAERGRFLEVREGPCRLLVNLEDYLDTGLFLDHRLTRALVAELAAGRRLLNLFAYTASASVHAALGGALETLSVDLSNTYLDWAQRNFELNGMDLRRHRLVQADCLAWLEQAAARGRERFGVVFLDPPTFSNSKRMAGPFDVQRHHPEVIRQAVSLLEPGGVLIFSTNARRFRLDEGALADLAPEDISAATLPRDFARNPRIHRCWRIDRP